MNSFMLDPDGFPWSTLGIQPTENMRDIKRAYAKKLKKCRPDDDAQAFQHLHEAFELAKAIASGNMYELNAEMPPDEESPTPDKPMAENEFESRVRKIFDQFKRVYRDQGIDEATRRLKEATNDSWFWDEHVHYERLTRNMIDFFEDISIWPEQHMLDLAEHFAWQFRLPQMARSIGGQRVASFLNRLKALRLGPLKSVFTESWESFHQKLETLPDYMAVNHLVDELRDKIAQAEENQDAVRGFVIRRLIEEELDESTLLEIYDRFEVDRFIDENLDNCADSDIIALQTKVQDALQTFAEQAAKSSSSNEKPWLSIFQFFAAFALVSVFLRCPEDSRPYQPSAESQRLYRSAEDLDRFSAPENYLLMTVRIGRSDLVKRALSQNPDVDFVPESGQTALFLATSQDATEVIKLLLDAGANPNLPGPRGWVPLHVAVQHGNLDAIHLLLDYGADPEKKVNGIEPSPVELAHSSQLEHIVRVLRTRQEKQPVEEDTQPR